MLKIRRPIGPDDRAKGLLAVAAGEAGRRGAAVAGAEDLLVAVAMAGGRATRVLEHAGVGATELRAALDAEEAQALAALGIELEEVRLRLERVFGDECARAATATVRCRGWSAEAQAALDAAIEVARTQGDRRVGPEHLLIALIRQQGRASRVLESMAADPAQLESELLGELPPT